MPARRSLISVGGDTVSGVVDGVVQVGGAGWASASHEDTGPIAQLDVSAQRSAGEPGGGILRGRSAMPVLVGDVGNDASPLAAAGDVRGELGEQAFGDAQLDDPTAILRGFCAAGVGPAPGDAREHQMVTPSVPARSSQSAESSPVGCTVGVDGVVVVCRAVAVDGSVAAGGVSWAVAVTGSLVGGAGVGSESLVPSSAAWARRWAMIWSRVRCCQRPSK
jgi:hypothetical protein